MQGIHEVKHGQSLADVALVQAGYLEAIAALAEQLQSSMTDEISSSALLKLPVFERSNPHVTRFFALRKAVPPATNEELLEGVDFWNIGFNFIIIK